MCQSDSLVCRFCMFEDKDMESKHVISIFNEQVEDLPPKIYKCTAIKVLPDDTIPPFICLRCYEVILNFHKFLETCFQTEKILFNLYNKNAIDLREIKKKSLINETENGNINERMETEDKNNAIEDIVNTDYGKLDESYVESDYENSILSDCDIPYNSHKNRDLSLSQDVSVNLKNVDKIHLEDYSKKLKYLEIDDTMKQIIGTNVYTCDICQKPFDSFFDYQDHQDVHNGDFVFKCSKCTKVFCERKQLVEHDSNHKMSCNICSLEVLPKSMPAHLLIHTDAHKCSECGMRHTSKAALLKHFKARHAGVKEFVCHICGKQTSCSSSMNRHMAYHSNDRPYKCDYCDFSAKSVNIVQVHTARRHFAEKTVCEICAKIFKSQPSLIQHMKRIHTTRKHRCDVCGKAFIEKYNLNKHLKKHSSRRLHECKLCHGEFFTVRSLKQHMHSHRQGCVNCPKCGKEFFYKKYFDKHVVKCTFSEDKTKS